MIDFSNVSKTYPNGTKALNNCNIHIDRGEFVFIVGSSGAGKSTFLKMIMREEVPSEGKIVVDGVELNKLKASKIPYYRRKLGIVFQDFRLIPNRTVYDNVAFAMHVIGAKNKDISRRVAYALSLVGLSVKAKCYPHELSGGEQQRVALARALVNHADIIVADEPTGNIDPEMSRDIVNLLNHINANNNTTVIMVTHEVDLVKQYNKRIITIKNGTVISDTAHPEIVVEDIPERVETAPTAYYEAPLEDDDIERFIQNYGKNTEESVNTEESAASEKSESSDSI
ncbi:MAG: cell division ATP-binding protein FtsE [Ruminococcaceae bacterium]|nr:cell division ATP-binding protein FtsE [Oscillospiraceae bacterium]MBR3596320.1 cell division ATP-binding protein FtsE [Clostridia bacterium]